MSRPQRSLEKVVEIHTDHRMGQCRAIPVQLPASQEPALLAVYSADFDVDPYTEMFFFPSDTLHLTLFSTQGEILWRRDLGKGVVPGMWFCPVYPFDLDSSGYDSLWLVYNPNEMHPLGHSHYLLEKIDAATGTTVGHWPWPRGALHEPLSHAFRNFIMGGFVHGTPVLLTAQGTYGDMAIQAWDADMSLRWETVIAADAPGAAGSHMCPMVDYNNDGVDELFWGERCFEIDQGRELFCADVETYHGHSDIIQPFRREPGTPWKLYVAREGHPEANPRVLVYDEFGKRLWGNVPDGHMDMGWIATLQDDYKQVASAIRIDEKTCGPDGRFHVGTKEFVFDAETGAEVALGYSTVHTLPVDLNGDGFHDLVYTSSDSIGRVIDRHGMVLGHVEGTAALACKFMDLPGEQLLTYQSDGVLTIWSDPSGMDSARALQRYRDPFYQASMRLNSSGYNLKLLGGI